MIAITYTEGNEYFNLNGKKYPQVYQAVAMGTTHVAIYSIHDIKNQLLSTTFYTEVSVNGVSFNSQDELITELIPILYDRASGSGVGGNTIDWQPIINTKEDAFTKNSAFNNNYGKSAGTVAEGNDTRFSKAETAYAWGNHADYGYLKSVGYADILNTPTTLGGYGITDAYTHSEIANFFTGITPILGYNKSNWDSAYNWGDHSTVGYITGITVSNDNINPITHNIGTVEGTVLSESVTQLNTPTLNGNTLTISFQNENNVAQTVSIDLSSLNLTETGITNATYDAAQNVITLEEKDGDVWTINLSEFSIISNTDAQGITNLTQEGTVKLTVSKVGQSGDYNDLLNVPTTLLDFGLQTEVDTKLSGKSDVGHTHDYSEITGTPNPKTKVRVINISADVLTTVDEAGVRAYLIENGYSKAKLETLVINIGAVTTEPTEPTTITVIISSPTEGQEITGDVNLAFGLENISGINILTPSEGQEITGDVSLTFELV